MVICLTFVVSQCINTDRNGGVAHLATVIIGQLGCGQPGMGPLPVDPSRVEQRVMVDGNHGVTRYNRPEP